MKANVSYSLFSCKLLRGLGSQKATTVKMLDIIVTRLCVDYQRCKKKTWDDISTTYSPQYDSKHYRSSFPLVVQQNYQGCVRVRQNRPKPEIHEQAGKEPNASFIK